MNQQDHIINSAGFNRQRREGLHGEDPLLFAPQDDHQSWLENRLHDLEWRNRRADAADAIDFDAWLDSPEGMTWLNGEAEGEAERAGYSPYAASAVTWH